MINPQQQEHAQQLYHPQHSIQNNSYHPHQPSFQQQVNMMPPAIPSSYSLMTTVHAASDSSQQQQQQQQPQPQLPQQPPLLPQAIFNGVNPLYPGLHIAHVDPPVFCVHDFLTPEECQFLIDSASDSFTPAPVVGKGAGEVSMTRTSSTCYMAREDLPDLMRKVSHLTGKPMVHMELPQVGRYLPTQQYYQHYDAFNLDDEDGRRFAANGGQRTVTVLIYLNDVARGGQTAFPTLQFEIAPVKGMAVIFFPATVNGVLDPRALHAALPAIDDKFVSQIWIRQHNYYGQPSKRLANLMGMPLTMDEIQAIPPGVTTGGGGGGGSETMTAMLSPAAGSGVVADATTTILPVLQQQQQQQQQQHHSHGVSQVHPDTYLF